MNRERFRTILTYFIVSVVLHERDFMYFVLTHTCMRVHSILIRKMFESNSNCYHQIMPCKGDFKSITSLSVSMYIHMYMYVYQ